MADYHFHVQRVKRSAGKSVVAAAAYRAGEKLKDDYYGLIHDYSKKEVVKSGIFLPGHAPPRLQDRETLWNEVEKVEKHPAAQLAYSFDFSLQNEFTMEENIELAERFIKEQFVDRGMICDYAIHNPHRDGDVPNPHVHVLCPIRPLNKNGEWGNKRRRPYALDEDGNRIRDANGDYIFTGEYITDWDSPETLEKWRQAWAEYNTGWASSVVSQRYLNMMSARFVSISVSSFISLLHSSLRFITCHLSFLDSVLTISILSFKY